ncbi:NAD(+)/NADH kinase [Natroniella sulfidigena]|uniref:NAD(+)/NADH kinase n=1 Tax=Natroniella sulfidigena TaxID=723921 RepID=UPI00200AAB5E|nr:NAD(+)/NADH kinase [Natroniella sulfidigena]
MNKIGLIANITKEQSQGVLGKVCDYLDDNNKEYILDEASAQLLERETIAKPYQVLVDFVDAIIVFGGDGTFLKAARTFVKSSVPILGINLGSLGFLTDIELDRLDQGLEELLNGNYSIEERIVLEGRLIREDKEIDRVVAINDLVITKGSFSRIINLKTFIDGKYVTTYPGDGLIISTPTGSTAYSLSAGGPIVNPKMESLIITPICPHTLHSRSIITTEDEKITVEIDADHSNIMLTVDGQDSLQLFSGDVIEFEKTDLVSRLIKLEDYNFYKVLRNRLQGNKF